MLVNYKMTSRGEWGGVKRRRHRCYAGTEILECRNYIGGRLEGFRLQFGRVSITRMVTLNNT